MEVIPFIYEQARNDDLASNSYLIIDDHKSCIVIDPSKDDDSLILFIHKNSLKPKAILLTHAHFDHMRGINRLQNKYKIPLYVGFDDEPALYKYALNCSSFNDKVVITSKDVITVSDNEKISLLNEDITVIYTPFHTIGSVCYLIKNNKILFSGDTLFRYTIGRTDLITSNSRLINSSLRKLVELDDDIVVFPGHGIKTTIGLEKRTNMFVKNI